MTSVDAQSGADVAGSGQTIRSVAQSCALPRLEQRMLWCQVLDVPRSWTIAHDDEPLPASAVTAFQALAARRLRGEPMAYLLGEREFLGRMFEVTPAVLIPRPDTELLVARTLAAIADEVAPRVVELGVGSGAVAVSLALARPDATVWATDASADALAVAQRNARRWQAPVQCFQGDWYAALPAGARFHVVVSNPPYIAAGDPHLSQGDVRFEPPQALASGPQGLDDLRRIVEQAPDWLAPGGWLLLEHGWDQADAVRDLLAQAGFSDGQTWPDLAGMPRVTGGRVASCGPL